jgi:hypothetical protein
MRATINPLFKPSTRFMRVHALSQQSLNRSNFYSCHAD